TQHNPNAPRGENGVVREGAGTIAVTGDMKEMSAEYIRGASLVGYGCSLMVGLGVPIPILNEELARFTGVSDRDIVCQVVDYGIDYPNAVNRALCELSYAELKSGRVEVQGRNIPAAPLSSYPMAVRVAENLKSWIRDGGFVLGAPQVALPSAPFPAV
ncbi:MAG TPA: homocysteine biosynthesis protein, partial [Spirochaetota bacterium]|nr:homocysteine biosynthesis protein [Spirochaetota bacterium]